MSAYNPPIENVPIFDSLLFSENNDATLTIADGDKRYLKFPIAQGDETLQGATIQGAFVANGSANFTSTSAPTSSGVIPVGDSSTKIPTTAWVENEIINNSPISTMTYTTAGTFTATKPSLSTHLKIVCIGGGGGGGGGCCMGNPSGGDKGANGGAGGGGGGITITDFDLVGTTDTTFTISVGNGGTAGASSTGANAGNGGAGGNSAVRGNNTNLYYAYATGGLGGGGATNQLAPNNTLQATGGLGGSGSQGVGGSGEKGVGLNNPTDQNTGFVFTGINGGQSALIGAGGGGGGGAIYETGGSGGNVYFDTY